MKIFSKEYLVVFLTHIFIVNFVLMFKKVRYILFFFLFCISGEIFSHPLHLTITNIEIEKDSINVAIHLFSSDIKLAILDFNVRKIPAIQTDTTDLSNENIDDYISAHLKIRTISGLLVLKNIRKNIDELSLWIYLNGEFSSNDTSIIIENNLLNNIYGDQRNLVIFSCNKKEEGIEFNATETKKTISLLN